MEWAECTPKTEIIEIDEFWYRYGYDMEKKLSDKTPIEVEVTDEFVIEAIGIYKKKKWYQIFKKKELLAVKLAYLRYAVID
jgi:beta-xylosidase